MNEDSYRKHRWTYSFRAWTDEQGSNEDRAHEHYCVCHAPDTHTHYEGVHRCRHLWLWDLNTRRRSKNIVRVMRRRRPFFLIVLIGPRYRTLLRLGALPW